jgi:thiol-disulfide isomerase/thioredoxin
MKRTTFLLLPALLLALLGCSGRQTSGAAVPELDEHPLRGSPAPEIDLPVVHGAEPERPRALVSHYAGRVLLLDFWATWCEPCKRSFPHYQQLAARYPDRIAVLGVSEDDENVGIAEFAAETGAAFPLVWDQGKSVAPRYRLKGMPTLFIVDQQGIVRFVKEGYLAGDEHDIERAVESLLAPAPPL